MSGSAILDDYLKRLSAVAPEDLLRWTGEELAMAAERLRSADATELTLRAEELLVTAHHHIQCLAEGNMPDQALATSLLAPLTVIMSRVNPEDIPVPYCHSLAVAAMASADYFGMQHSSEGLNTAASIYGSVTGLLVSTVKSYSAKTALPSALVSLSEHLSDASKAQDAYTDSFSGHKIVPTMAIDILVDSLNLLRSQGVEF